MSISTSGPSGAGTGSANQWGKAQSVTPVVADVAGNVTPDATASNNFEYRLTGNLVLGNPTGPVSGQVLNFRLKQDATGGRTITWPGKFKFPEGAAPLLSTPPGAVDFVSAYYCAADDRYECGFNPGLA